MAFVVPIPDAPRGRYAPSPTGLIHLGNARTALVAWLSIRQQQGTFIWRTEDLDPPRILIGAEEMARNDLSWLGLDWDEGPMIGGPYAPYQQSERRNGYEAALVNLHTAGRLFPCRLSRKDLRDLASAPHGPMTSPYPAHLRPKNLPTDWFATYQTQTTPNAALRFRVHERPVTFFDRVQGSRTEQVHETVGDFVLKRKDGLFAYQLAVVVDDALMGITEVVRGADLLDSTTRQIQLIEALGLTPPSYAHVPLMITPAGEKFSKRDQHLTLQTLREEGIAPDQIVGYLAYSLGLQDTTSACTPSSLIPDFSWDVISRDPWVVPLDIAAVLRQIV